MLADDGDTLGGNSFFPPSYTSSKSCVISCIFSERPGEEKLADATPHATQSNYTHPLCRLIAS